LEKIRFDQKKKWDEIAWSFLKDCSLTIDAGCGEGRFISQNPSKIVGVDWNDNSLKKCKERGYNIVKADIRNLPFQDESISGIHCSHVIEHFLPQDVHKILSEFCRVLAPRGILIIRSPLLWNKFYSDLTHIRPYNPGAITHYLTPSNQRTLKHISQDFEVIYLKWRYRPLRIGNKYLNAIFGVLNRWGFPWIQKNGYMLIMRKNNRSLDKNVKS